MRAGADILIVLLLIVINGLFSLSEMALVSARRTRLISMERKHWRGAAAARAMAEDPQHFLPTVQVGITLVSVLAGSFGGPRLAEQLTALFPVRPEWQNLASNVSFTIVVMLITFVTLVFGELVPKQLALRRPEILAAATARPLKFATRVMSPFVWLLRHASTLALRLFGPESTSDQTMTEEELKQLVAEGAQTGMLVHEEREMIERVLRLADKPVRALMTPRTELSWIDRTHPKREIIIALQESPHSRLVVCDGGVDNPVGVVLAKDMLDRLLDGADFQIAAVMRKPIVIPDTVSALGTMERLKADPLGMALVMDEYGSFEGVVTASDVLEAIVGELQSGADPHQPGAVSLAEPMLMDGLTPIDEVKARLALPDLPAHGTYHTLAGLLLALLRRVPRLGDQITFGGVRFEVVDMDGRRVAKVRISNDKLPLE